MRHGRKCPWTASLRPRLKAPSLALAFAAVAGCSQPTWGAASPTAARLVAEPWPEAEALFRRDPRWLGGDAVYSIDLGADRVLWLFGDSFVATSPRRVRRESTMVRNSIALQRGYDPAAAGIAFHWREVAGRPSAFFAAPTKETWYWPAHGAPVGGELVLFLWEIRSVPYGLGFTGVGWTAVVVENPGDDPLAWRIVSLATSSTPRLALGSAVVTDSEYLYAFSTGLELPDRAALARWPLAAVRARSLAAPEWCDRRGGWIAQDRLSGLPPNVGDIGQSEFGVHRLRGAGGYLLVHTVGFGGSVLAYQTAPALGGSWSGARTFYEPPERSRPGVLIYSAKLHPMLHCPGFAVVASYSTNHTDFATLVDDMTLYFPRLLRAAWK